MYSGWTVKWPVNRQLTQSEKDAALPRQPQSSAEADDRGSLTAFNSTYVEFVGRRFKLRGGFATLLASCVSVFFIFVAIYVWFALKHINSSQEIGLIVVTCASLAGAFATWWMGPRLNFFTHTYYPIRFNRKTRMVYVFRDKRDGGILTMPWEQGFFHIGKGLRDKRLLDMRCHILDGEKVKDTFVTGMYYLEKERVEQLWGFVRRYMDDGIESLGKVEVWTSPEPTWMNCGIMASVNTGNIILLWPFKMLLAGMRWLVLRTCEPPVWPDEIEAACKVEPNDPHDLPKPEYIGQFATERVMAGKQELP